MPQEPGETTVITQAGDSLAAAAQRASNLLEFATDPLVWLAVISASIKVFITIGLALAFIATLKRVMGRWQKQVKDLPNIDPRRQRVLTGTNLITSVAQYVVWGIASIMVLSELGLDIGPLLAGAGIAGLAIGFGAQTLVKDVISGLFLLFDDILHVGDLVTFDGHAGVVEGISLRVIRVRKFDGELMMVPAGDLRTFGNKSVGFARVVVTIGVTYEQDTDIVLEALGRIAQEWAELEENRAILLEPEPQVQAILDLGDSAVNARIVVQVVPGEQFAAERRLRLLVKRRLDEWGIEIPFPRRTVYIRQQSDLPQRKVELPPLPVLTDDGTEGAD